MNDDTRPMPIIQPTTPAYSYRNTPFIEPTTPAYPYNDIPFNNPTTPAYPPYNPYNPYESLSPYPPLPPMKSKRHGFLWAFGIVLIVALVSLSLLGYELYGRTNSNAGKAAPTFITAQPTPKPTIIQPTPTSDSRNTSNQEYTADTILQDFIMAGASPTVLDHNITIWNWTKELGYPYYISVHAKSSVTFRDSSGCSGPCDGFLNGGIWVYSDYVTTYRAYEDASTDQEQQMLTPPTGPAIIPSVFRHGRCVLLGPDNNSIYTTVVAQYCL